MTGAAWLAALVYAWAQLPRAARWILAAALYAAAVPLLVLAAALLPYLPALAAAAAVYCGARLYLRARARWGRR